MDNIKKQTEPHTTITDLFNGTLGSVKSGRYETDNLYELLCVRYNLNRFTTKQKLVDLVVKELDI